MLHFTRSRLSFALILLSIFTANTQASSIPQQTSTGIDGNFNLLTDDILFSNADNIYNFIDFNIADGATLSISNSGPVYIYAQQSITISGNIIAASTDLHLITSNSITLSGNININSLLLAIDGTSSTSTPDTSGAVIISGNPDASITTGYIDTTTTGNISLIDTTNNILTPVNNGNTTGSINLNPAPVPLPAALWLMISGLLSLGLINARNKT